MRRLRTRLAKESQQNCNALTPIATSYILSTATGIRAAVNDIFHQENGNGRKSGCIRKRSFVGAFSLRFALNRLKVVTNREGSGSSPVVLKPANVEVNLASCARVVCCCFTRCGSMLNIQFSFAWFSKADSHQLRISKNLWRIE